MHPNLVCAPGFDERFGEGITFETLQCPVKRQGWFSGVGDGHFSRDDRVFADGFVDFAFVVVQHAVEQGEVKFVGCVAFKLDRKVPVRGLIKVAVGKIMEGMYGPTGEVPDLSNMGDSSPLFKAIDRYGPAAMAALEKVKAARDRVLGRK